jgi:hypothetical protein
VLSLYCIINCVALFVCYSGRAYHREALQGSSQHDDNADSSNYSRNDDDNSSRGTSSRDRSNRNSNYRDENDERYDEQRNENRLVTCSIAD